MRESRRQLLLAGDADRRRIERALHEGVQQDLVALAVNLQLAGALIESDPAKAKQLVDDLARDVRRSLDETASLAQRIHPPPLERGGLAAALRSAAAGLGVQAAIEATAVDGSAPEVVRTVYFSCVDALERVGPDGRAAIEIRGEAAALVFDIDVRPQRELEDLRGRIEAAGGELVIEAEADGTRASGTLPL